MGRTFTERRSAILYIILIIWLHGKYMRSTQLCLKWSRDIYYIYTSVLRLMIFFLLSWIFCLEFPRDHSWGQFVSCYILQLSRQLLPNMVLIYNSSMQMIPNCTSRFIQTVWYSSLMSKTEQTIRIFTVQYDSLKWKLFNWVELEGGCKCEVRIKYAFIREMRIARRGDQPITLHFDVRDRDLSIKTHTFYFFIYDSSPFWFRSSILKSPIKTYWTWFTFIYSGSPDWLPYRYWKPKNR